MTYFGGVFGPLKKQAYDEGKAEGRAEGRAEAKAAGMAFMLIELLTQKFGMVPDAIRHKIEAAPVDALMRWSIDILEKNSLDEIFS